jgi:glycosyltransferase involved in cell wall biosynthesis
MSRFPKLTETFILFEMLAVEREGVQVEIYPLLRARETAVKPEGASLLTKIRERLSKPTGEVKMHSEAEPLVARAHYLPFLSWPIIGAQFYYLFRKPLAYLGALWTVIRANLGSSNYLVGVLSVFPKVAYMARRMAADGVAHVHAHFANHPAAAAFVIHRLSGIPYSFTAHGADLQVDQHMLREKVAESAFTVTISKFNKEFILEKVGEEHRDRVLVVYCGVDTEVFYPSDAATRQANRSTYDLMCTGTLYEVKGHTYLIEACRLLKERGLDIRCHLVGDGPFRLSLMEQVAQSGLAGEVIFHGQKTRHEIADMLRRVDVVSVPSIPTSSGRREGIPVVLMEAMASGVPVVASSISGIPELVVDGQTGLLIPARDPEALANALERLHREPDVRARLGQASRERVMDHFDLYTNAALLIRHFSQEGQL